MNAREKLDEFAEMTGMNKNQLIGWSVTADFAEWYVEQVKNCSIPAVVGRSEQLKAEDKDLPFADYLEKWYELPRYEKVYDRKDGKGTDTEDEVIKNYRRAFRL